MSLQKIDIYSLRNITKASIEPLAGINLITGENASGKSSLLEAIFILGRARSFRATNLKQTIQFDQSEFIVSGRFENSASQARQMGVKHNGKVCDIRINQQNSSKADLAYSLPVLLIHPKSYKLLDAGPQIRREFLDWGVFNYEHQFLSQWRQFKKILQQRNALLKKKQSKQLNVWNTEFVEYGTIVDKQRKEYLELLKPVFYEISDFFLGLENLQLQLFSGWDNTVDLLSILDKDLEKDLRYGYTHSGPHRCDFSVTVNGRLAKDFVSRGQLKLLMLALKLAQVKLINSVNNAAVCLLIDDLTAELDLSHKAKLLDYLDALNCQVFMSTTELANFGDLSKLTNYKVFHVEHGTIKSL